MAKLRQDRHMAKLTIPYPDDLLLSLKESPEEFEAEARLLLAVKLYELGRVSTGRAAEMAGLGRVEFLFALGRFGLSPIGVDPEEVAEDFANA
jgi:predicted HTH domain antitoxin